MIAGPIAVRSMKMPRCRAPLSIDVTAMELPVFTGHPDGPDDDGDN
ncbi:hypothetical protein B932_1776 [Gluconobacter oxydans H24]|nr:hypothetical protein B932_1776 [Gluconobacter oxydans H24]